MIPSLTALDPRAPARVPVDAHLPPELARVIARNTQNSHGALEVKLTWVEPIVFGLHNAKMSISLEMDSYGDRLPDWVAPASRAGVEAMCTAANDYRAANAGVKDCRVGPGYCGVVKMAPPSQNGWASGAAAAQSLRGTICNFTPAQKDQFRNLCEALAVLEDNRDHALGRGKPYTGPPVEQARAAVLDHVRPLARGPFEAFAAAFLGAAGQSVTPLAPREKIFLLMPRDWSEDPGRYVEQCVVTYKFPFMFPAPPGSAAYNRLMRQLAALEFYNEATDGRRDQWKRTLFGREEEERPSDWSDKRSRG